MSQSAKFSRRKFMQITAVATAAGPLASCVGTGTSWRCLSEDEGRMLTAICERIIPADQDPGAGWAGVVTYIDRQLAGPYRRFRKTYRWGLAGTNATSLTMFGKPFTAVTPEQQDAVLQSMEKGQARGEGWKQVSAKSFFDMVASHTMQGFYGDPRHGGNRERVSWKMLRLAYPPVRGRLVEKTSTDDADFADRKSG
jgi:gluconate 2-dehydrogenase gamma chain